jgi:murein DD-endopeptidase MepM/ murein hydrolase activator NlpD
VVTAAQCVTVPDRPCIDRFWVAPGGRIELRGRNLVGATQVLFYGGRGRADDLSAPVEPGQPTGVFTTVPATAQTGPLAVVGASGTRSRRFRGLLVDGAALQPPLPQTTGPAPAIGAKLAEDDVFYGGVRKATFGYRIAASRPTDIIVSLLRVADGTVVRSWQKPQVQPGTVQRVAWNGRARGKVQPEGRYMFRAAAAAAGAAQAGAGVASSEDDFTFHDHMFPIRGRHDFGTGGGRFGAGRTGHSHQGQDIFAACGTPMVAARAGKVAFSGFHRAAGYYVVIHGSSRDYFYAHLREPALVATGERVFTGQPIGEVGESGNAQGCHLHFELWSAPGWYRGGRPFDPLAELRRWDQTS